MSENKCKQVLTTIKTLDELLVPFHKNICTCLSTSFRFKVYAKEITI